MKKTIKFFKLKKVKVANLNMINGIIAGGKSDGCNSENTCDENAACIPETTQSTKNSNVEEDCNNSIPMCITNYSC